MEKTNAYTAGPWEVVTRPDPDYIDIQAGKATVAAVRNYAGLSNAQRDANARLIAKAPELLALARAVLDAWHGNSRNFDRAEPAYLADARLLIAEIEGGG